ncbi:MAG: thioredoxin-disulfide reductase [Lachnospiraceae bacterium]
MYDLIIIGSGPAGLAAAIYAQRAELNTLVIEKEMMSGGQIINTYEVENYPGIAKISGFDLADKFRDHAEALKAQFVTEQVYRIEKKNEKNFEIYCSRQSFSAKAVLIATGAHHKKLGVPGEESCLGKGVSYCATCDGAFFRNREVAVVGGGDVAVEDAIYLARMCKKVYLIHRRDSLRAAKSLQSQLFKLKNVECIWNSTVKEIVGNPKVNSILIERNGRNEFLNVSGVFIAVGIQPESDLFRGLVEQDKDGYIVAGEDGITSMPGIFVAGDVRTKKLRQIITAASDGANAVMSAENWLMQ